MAGFYSAPTARLSRRYRGRLLHRRSHLEPAFAELNRDGIPTPLDIIKHITPLGWQHISLTGDYIWTPTDGVDLRPLRRETSILAA